MNTRNFEVLYTHQKLKKAKTWQDGCLRISSNGTKAVLFDDQGCSLEVFHIHSHKIFPGSDVECERYLISIGDEKIPEGTIQDKSSTSHVFTDCSNSSRYGANNGPATRSDLGSTLGKRKRDVHDTFKPNLPRPRQDFSPGIQSFDLDNYNTRGKNLEYNQLAPKTSGANEFYPQKTYQGTISINSKESTQQRDIGSYNTRDTNVNFNRMPSISHGENNFLHLQRTFQGPNENSFPTQKRNRSELLSLFGGKSRVVPDKQKQGRSSNETIAPLQQNLNSTVSGSENVPYKKTLPTTNNPFSRAFDISLGDEEDFSDTSFQSLYNPKSKTIRATTSRLNGQTWHSDETEVNDVNACHDEYVDPEIDDVLLDYNHDNNSKSNDFTPATFRLNSLPWKANESQVIRGRNDLDNKDFDEEMDSVVFDDDYDNDGFGMFSTSSETTRSLAGHKVEYKDQRFCNRNINATCIPSWESKESQVGVGSNVLVNGHFDPEFINVVSDDYDDEFAMFSTSSGRSTSVVSGRNMEYQNQSFADGNARRLTVDDDTLRPFQENATEREQPNNMPSTSRSFLQNRLHSSSRNIQFTPPLMVSVKNNPRASSSYEKDYRSSDIERVTVGSSVRPQSFSGELYFPSNAECCGSVTPTRQVIISTKFTSAMEYKGVLKSSLREHLNIILFELAQKYHGILCKADITSSDDTISDQKENVKGPSCSHGPAKLRAVKKDGPNKGRHFYTCPGSSSNQCKFFQWADESQTVSTTGTKKISLTSTDSVRVFFKSEGIYFYHNCLMERRSQPTKFFGKKHSRKSSNMDYGKKVMYIVLKYRDSSSLYTKDDIWIISKSINFEPRTTFVAKSTFYGPSSSGDLEIEPVSGYSPSNWRSGDTVHAIWVCNAGTELSCIQNLDDYVTLQQMPLLPYILNGSHPSYGSQRSQRYSFSAPLSGSIDRNSLGISWPVIEQETEKMIALHNLNTDQAAALRSCAKMFVSGNEDRMECLPITLIHGVFGAGKSFLLAVVVLLMARLFEFADASDEGRTRSITWKILISSTTNVAVDRILLGLLDLGFDQFVRVGSVRKIAKPVLPFSIHSTGTESQELKELQGMLKTELTSSEKAYVRKSIEIHKLGENRKRLADVRVVGVTCAACTFAALERLKFPVLLLDECSQMTEPTSLLPMARFGCRKLVLVGDPKQLNPTIQGSEPSHESSLEQTLFDRLIKMDFKPILLRMQYRCHPVISSISNRLFYNDQLLDGVNAEEREPLVDFVPTLCFFNVSNGREECSQDGSYFNSAEAKFVVVLIKSLLESEVEPKQIGVITQYKSQLTAITSSLSADGGTSHKEWAGIQISTVDAFQGGEKDVTILSCVRTKHIGFIDCERRTNVALTRAKRHLCIVGCGKILSSNSLWSKILTFCREFPEGFQSSESYIKQWNERRPKEDDNFTKGTSSKPKKARKSRKGDRGKNTSKPSNEAHTQDSSVETEAMPRCDSSSNKRSELIEVQEIFDSDPTLDNENIYSDPLSDFVDNGDVYEISDKPDAIEISDKPEAPRDDIPDDNGKVIEISGNNDCSDDVRKDLQKEITIVEKGTNDSESNCSDYMFVDDSLMDDELCTLDF